MDYEDPRYPVDAAVATNPASLRRRHANAANFRREAFTVEFNSGSTPASRPDETTVLTAVVDAYNDSNGAAQFELRKNEAQARRYAVVGIGIGKADDKQGTSQQPILDLPLTLPIKRRSAEQTIT